MTGRCDASRAIHVDADIVGSRIDTRRTAFTGVHAHAHPDGRTVREHGRRERALRGGGGSDRLHRHREHHEQGIALDPDLETAILERLAENARVRLEDVLVTVGPELVLELGRALDVGEKKREGAGRQPSPHTHAAWILRHLGFAKTAGTP